MFSRSVVEVLSRSRAADGLSGVKDGLISLLNSLVAVVTQALPPHKYQTIVSLIVTLVHSRDIVTDLIENQVSVPVDFTWKRLVSIKLFEKILFLNLFILVFLFDTW